MNKNKIIQLVIAITSIAVFVATSIIAFIYGKSFYNTDWFFLIYVLGVISYLFGLLGVILPKLVFKLFSNRFSTKSAEKSSTGCVVPEYMQRHFFMKFRWGLLGFGLFLVLILAIVVLVMQ